MERFSIKSEVSSFTEVMKSKFIAIAFPCDGVEKFKSKLEYVRKSHPKAKHVVYAYKIGVNSKSTDDREPKGTAGRPLLELLNKKHLENVALIVVRYFGGTELGAGRLLRTYVTSGASALNNAEIINF